MLLVLSTVTRRYHSSISIASSSSSSSSSRSLVTGVNRCSLSLPFTTTRPLASGHSLCHNSEVRTYCFISFSLELSAFANRYGL